MGDSGGTFVPDAKCEYLTSLPLINKIIRLLASDPSWSTLYNMIKQSALYNMIKNNCMSWFSRHVVTDGMCIK